MKHPIEPFVISGEGVLTPPGRDRWVTEEMFLQAGQKPLFTVMEVAHCFFGRSTVWLRKKLEERVERFEPIRLESGHRRFGLHQVEDFAHMLLQDGAILPLQLAMTVRIIKSVAVVTMTYEIGDSGFLQAHWNGSVMARRKMITLVMERLEEWDAGRSPELPDSVLERSVAEAARAVRRGETLTSLEDR